MIYLHITKIHCIINVHIFVVELHVKSTSKRWHWIGYYFNLTRRSPTLLTESLIMCTGIHTSPTKHQSPRDGMLGAHRKAPPRAGQRWRWAGMIGVICNARLSNGVLRWRLAGRGQVSDRGKRPRVLPPSVLHTGSVTEHMQLHNEQITIVHHWAGVRLAFSSVTGHCYWIHISEPDS